MNSDTSLEISRDALKVVNYFSELEESHQSVSQMQAQSSEILHGPIEKIESISE